MTKGNSLGVTLAFLVPLTVGAYGQTKKDTICTTPEMAEKWRIEYKDKVTKPYNDSIARLNHKIDSLKNLPEKIQYLPGSGGDINIKFGDTYFVSIPLISSSQSEKKKTPAYTKMPVLNLEAGRSITSNKYLGEMSVNFPISNNISLGPYLNFKSGKDVSSKVIPISEESTVNESINLKLRTAGTLEKTITHSSPLEFGLSVSMNKRNLNYGIRIGATKEYNLREEISKGVTQLLQGNRIIEEKEFCTEPIKTEEKEFVLATSVSIGYDFFRSWGIKGTLEKVWSGVKKNSLETYLTLTKKFSLGKGK